MTTDDDDDDTVTITTFTQLRLDDLIAHVAVVREDLVNAIGDVLRGHGLRRVPSWRRILRQKSWPLA